MPDIARVAATIAAVVQFVLVFFGTVASIFAIERYLFPQNYRAWLTKLIKREAFSAPWEHGDPPRTIAQVLLSSTHFFDRLSGH